MKTNGVFKRAYNRSLSLLDEYEVPSDIGSEPSWSETLGVSRTTVRVVLRALADSGLITVLGRRKVLIRRPAPADRFPEGETTSARDIVEKRFMQLILSGDCRPGQQINGLDLARQFGVSTSAVRDYLGRFSQFGLLDKRPNGGWVFRGFTREFAEELFEIRVMFEQRSAQRFIALSLDDPAWRSLQRIREEHVELLKEAQTRYSDFSELDERFHRLINDASRNRFIVGFYDVISLIFHYHYQWSKKDEKKRNIAAIREHLTYIDALRGRDRNVVAASCRAHMVTARKTLMRSIPQFDKAT